MWGGSSSSSAPPDASNRGEIYTSLPSLRTAGASASQVEPAPLMVTKAVVDGRPLVSPRGHDVAAARELMVAGLEGPGKSMKNVGQGGGDYVKVTTFRYVGKGGGEFNTVPLSKPSDDDDDCSFSWWQVGLALACIAACLGALCWVIWPMDGAALFERSEATAASAFMPSRPAANSTASPYGVDVSVQITGVDFQRVLANGNLNGSLTAGVREAFAFYLGDAVPLERIGSQALPGGRVHVDIVPPESLGVAALQQRLNFTSLASAVVANLQAIGGLQEDRVEPIRARIINAGTFDKPDKHMEAGEAIQAVEWLRVQTREIPERNDSEAREMTIAPQEAAAAQDAAAEHVMATCKDVLVVGATGASAPSINGRFVAQARPLNGHPIYRKEGAETFWLAFLRGRWYLTDSQRVKSNSGGGWLYSQEAEAPSDTPVQSPGWEEWNGTAWKVAEGVKVKCQDAAAGAEEGGADGVEG